MKKKLSIARVGFLIFIGTLFFVVSIFLVGEKSFLFSRTFFVYANFSSAEGVKPGAIVIMSGYNIGTVTDMTLSPNADSVRLLLRLSESVHPFIKVDSKAEIKQEGLVGNKIINLIIGSPKYSPIDNYDFVQSVPPFALTGLADNISSITDTTKIVTGELKNLLVRLNRGQGTIGKLLTDDALYRNIEGIADDVHASLTTTLEQLNRLSIILSKTTQAANTLVLKADTSIQNTNRITSEVATLVSNINAGKGTIGALLNDRKLYDSLTGLISALTDISYDAGNAANQAAQSIHAMRQHWLLGRVFGGESMEKETPPVPSYQRKMLEARKRMQELEKREERIRQLELKLGIKESIPGK
jgi:phospholipid/cholesterol/gamma-HCH transport system substrate-binding protein